MNRNRPSLYHSGYTRDVPESWLLHTFSTQRYFWPKKVWLWYGATTSRVRSW